MPVSHSGEPEQGKTSMCCWFGSAFLAFQHHHEFVAADVLADGDVLAHAFKGLFQVRQVVGQMTDPAAELEHSFLMLAVEAAETGDLGVDQSLVNDHRIPEPYSVFFPSAFAFAHLALAAAASLALTPGLLRRSFFLTVFGVVVAPLTRAHLAFVAAIMAALPAALNRLLPRAQKQAHERIIGDRKVDNAEKVLSLYEPDIQVLVRGKAGAEVEFGNKLLLGENRQGIILDYQMWQETVPADASLLVESLERVVVGLKKKMGAVGSDRGFASKANSVGLAEAEIFDSLCPRSPATLKERMKEPRFVRMQKRRSQTEGRISILQRGFLGRPMRAKGFVHRQLAVAWGVWTHNLWMLARLKREKKESLRQAA
jgi:hypothetical protein